MTVLNHKSLLDLALGTWQGTFQLEFDAGHPTCKVLHARSDIPDELLQVFQRVLLRAATFKK